MCEKMGSEKCVCVFDEEMYIYTKSIYTKYTRVYTDDRNSKIFDSVSTHRKFTIKH